MLFFPNRPESRRLTLFNAQYPWKLEMIPVYSLRCTPSSNQCRPQKNTMPVIFAGRSFMQTHNASREDGIVCSRETIPIHLVFTYWLAAAAAAILVCNISRHCHEQANTVNSPRQHIPLLMRRMHIPFIRLCIYVRVHLRKNQSSTRRNMSSKGEFVSSLFALHTRPVAPGAVHVAGFP